MITIVFGDGIHALSVMSNPSEAEAKLKVARQSKSHAHFILDGAVEDVWVNPDRVAYVRTGTA